MRKRVIYFNDFVIIVGYVEELNSYSLVISNTGIDSPVFDSINLGVLPKVNIENINFLITGIGCFVPDTFWNDLRQDELEESNKFEAIYYSNNGEFKEVNGSELALITKKLPRRFNEI